MVKYQVRKIETCPVCGGVGYVQNADWQEICEANNRFMEEHGISGFQDERAVDDWNQRIKEKWPYRDPPPEEENCDECEGKGEIKCWVDLRSALLAIGN